MTGFSSFSSTEDAYAFLRQQALAAEPEGSAEPCVIFDLATVPLPWFDANGYCRKACVLRTRNDVEMFIRLSERLITGNFDNERSGPCIEPGAAQWKRARRAARRAKRNSSMTWTRS